MNKPFITGILNLDGTEFKPPENPLKEKWDKLYPPTRNGEPCSPVLGYKEYGTPYMNYTCVLCCEKKCQHSGCWKVPDEDKEVYEQYNKEWKEYFVLHNPDYKIHIEKNIEKMLSEEEK